MTTPARYFAVYINAGNDTNGNPRRGWIVYDLVTPNDGATWIEEGYGNFPWPTFAELLGIDAADYFDARDKVRPYIRETGRINVTPGEYRDARKLPRLGK